MRVLLFISTLCFIFNAAAQYQVVVSEQIIEEADERKARAEAIDKATDAVTVELVKQEIGEARFKENSSKVETQVKGLKNRFIPFFKIVSSQKEGEGYRFKIEVKVSKKDLREILRQKGLFASAARTGITIPFIEFNNNLTGETYRWWSSVFTVGKYLESLALTFEKEFYQGFLGKGLFLLKPQAFKMVHMVPDFMRKTYLSQTEKIQLTNLKRGQLFVEGRVDLLNSPLRENTYRVRVQLSCKQASNGKSVAEVVRTYDGAQGQQLNQLTSKVVELAREAGRDMADQVYDLWQRGALEAQVLQLAVTGDLNHQQHVLFKKTLTDSIGLNNGLVERLYEPGRVTYEMDYRGGVEALRRKLNQTKLEGFLTQVVSSQADRVTLDVRVSQ